MTLLAFTVFSGIAPRLAPIKLAEGQAQVARNVRLSRRTLVPWKQPLQVSTVAQAGNPSTIYRFGQAQFSDTQYWLNWPANVRVAKGALNDDTNERTYFIHPTLGIRRTDVTLALTGGSGDYPRGSVPLGVPAPTLTPSATASGGVTSSKDDRVYAFTYVTSAGEESAPSEPSAIVTVNSGGQVAVGNLGTAAPTGYSHVTAKRIYRSASGSQTTELQLVDEIPVSQATYLDTKTTDQLGETIPSATWQPPPSNPTDLVQLANGIMLVMKGYDIFPSESYYPHAYPVAYQQSVDSPIVGGASFGNYAVICTTRHPYLLNGTDPGSLALDKVPLPQACVSQRSIVSVGTGVMYASPDGLVLVDSTGNTGVLTENLISQDDWRSFNPASIHGYFWEGRYVGFYDNGTTQGGFIFEPREGDAAFTLIDTYATAGYSDLLQDALFLKVGNSIVKWNAGAGDMTYTWRSRVNLLAAPENLGAAQVYAAAYPVTLKVYSDGALVHTQTVTSNLGFRLPAGFRSRLIEIEVTGTAEVSTVYLASTMQELKRVP